MSLTRAKNVKAALLFAIFLPFSILAEGDPFDALDKMLEDRFQSIDHSLEEQYQLMDKALEAAYQRLGKEVAASWGDAEVILPTRKEWVDYSPDLQIRRLINFELGFIKLERLMNPDDTVEEIVSELSDAAQSITTDSLSELGQKDLTLTYARESLALDGIELSVPPQTSQEPVLKGVSGPLDVMQFNSLVANALRDEDPEEELTISNDFSSSLISVNVKKIGPNKKKITIKIPLLTDYDLKLADKYYSVISHEAKKRKLQASLLFAVMETESSFNPRARSGAPAFGLMQLVPRSGAMDAYEYIHGDKILLDPEYLYQTSKNVELGAAYLDLLHNRYLRHISNPLAREYCAIAAYNTGAGNVARSFTGTNDVRQAAKIINEMSPAAVYDHLRAKLPHEETRRYILKVTKAKKKYEIYDNHTEECS